MQEIKATSRIDVFVKRVDSPLRIQVKYTFTVMSCLDLPPTTKLALNILLVYDVLINHF